MKYEFMVDEETGKVLCPICFANEGGRFESDEWWREVVVDDGKVMVIFRYYCCQRVPGNEHHHWEVVFGPIGLGVMSVTVFAPTTCPGKERCPYLFDDYWDSAMNLGWPEQGYDEATKTFRVPRRDHRPN